MTYILVSKTQAHQIPILSSFVSGLLSTKIEDITKHNSPDIHIMNPEDANSIGIEEIKDFQKEMQFKPFQEVLQIAAILQAEKLTHQAQNSLLKTLEEAPDHTIYILCVNNERNLLATIRSRGRTVYDHTMDTLNNETLSDKSFWEKDLYSQFQLIEEYAESKLSANNFLDETELLFKNKLEFEIKNGNIDSSRRQIEMLKILQEGREKISANCNRRLVLESMLMRLKA